MLLVPNAALRFRPRRSMSPRNSAKSVRGLVGPPRGRRRRWRQPAADDRPGERGHGLGGGEDGYFRPVALEVGLSDGIRTEIRRRRHWTTNSEVVTGVAPGRR